MRREICLFVAVSCFAIFCLPFGQTSAQTAAPGQTSGADTSRAVAVTIDDLPTVGGRNLPRMQVITAGLLGHLADYDIPAFGFVNERSLGEPEALPERVALLERWLDAGYGLGNHTYSHPRLYDTPLPDYQADVLRGEVVTARLLGERPRYFRHPYLNTGPDLETKEAFERFLAEEGYEVAPVTIDNDEWIYAFAYDKAEAAGDTALAARIGADYVRYMEEMFVFYEELSQDLLGREPAQVLLIHANALNADYLDELAEMIEARGYRFISLERALQDPAYSLLDEYAGESGLSWLQRWWITQGNERRKEPYPPEWVVNVAYPDRNR